MWTLSAQLLSVGLEAAWSSSAGSVAALAVDLQAPAVPQAATSQCFQLRVLLGDWQPAVGRAFVRVANASLSVNLKLWVSNGRPQNEQSSQWGSKQSCKRVHSSREAPLSE